MGCLLVGLLCIGAAAPMILVGERGGDICWHAYEDRHGPVVGRLTSNGWSWRPYGLRCTVVRSVFVGDGRTEQIVVNPWLDAFGIGSYVLDS